MYNGFSPSKESINQRYAVINNQSNEVNSNDTDPAASAGFFPGAHDFSISQSQLMEVHGNYYVCD